jgi:hypothetical protein
MIEWWCSECKKIQPGSLAPSIKPLSPGEDPPNSNPACPVCGTKMMPRRGQD